MNIGDQVIIDGEEFTVTATDREIEARELEQQRKAELSKTFRDAIKQYAK